MYNFGSKSSLPAQKNSINKKQKKFTENKQTSTQNKTIFTALQQRSLTFDKYIYLLYIEYVVNKDAIAFCNEKII